jgi:hypothetical protein
MRTVKALIQAILHPRTPKKHRLWYMGLLALFCIVSFLCATGTLSTPAFAAEHVPAQPGGHTPAQNNLSGTPPPEIPIQTDCATPQTDPSNIADCTNVQGTQDNQSIQNPIAANSPLMFFTDPAYTTGLQPVNTLWLGMLYIVDGFIVVVLMLNGIIIMLGGSVFRYSKAIEALPGILLALIVANVSMTFITLTLGLNNVMSRDLYNWTQKSGLQSANPSITQLFWQHPISQSWSPVYDNTGYDQPPANAKCSVDTTDTNVPLQNLGIEGGQLNTCTWPTFTITPQGIDFTKLDISSLMKSIPGALDLMIDVMALTLIAQVIIRIFFINLYIVFAPLGIACWAMPANVGRGLTSMWFKGFISTVLVQFVQMTAIILLQLILDSLLTYFTGTGQIHSNILSPSILTKLINVAFLWFIFRIPSMFNTAPMRSMVEIGQTMSQTVSAFVGMQFAEAQAQTAEIWGGAEGVGGMAMMGIARVI